MKKIIYPALIVCSFLTLVSCASKPDIGKSNAESSSSELKNIHGVVIDSSPSTLTMMSPQGKIYTFDIASAQKNLKHGFKSDSRVLVAYQGELQGLSTKNAKVMSVSDYSVW